MTQSTLMTIAGEIDKGSLTSYRSHKTVHAMPMTRGEYNTRRRWTMPHYEDPAEPGYLVIYNLGTCREYVSWSPDDIFDEGHAALPEWVQPGRGQLLFSSVGGGCLHISIGVDLIAHAVSMGPAGMGCVTVTNADTFAQSLAAGLLREEEDGSTPVHRMFDDVAEQLAEDGEAVGIRFDDEDDNEGE
ncbi:hypothetical protein [Aeromonas hydrophila]|uniref:hypothetical protein n=1 Tax=Aeromonas hydrophila TaxID=644 RepID=UPI00068BC579|nr:hypothetical protein [Aeromonas hydrophila]